MKKIFLYGTLRDDVLRQIVAGETQVAQAELPGYRCLGVGDGVYPTLVEGGGPAPGLLCTVSGTGLARMDFYEGAFGYRRHPVRARVAGNDVAAEVYLSDDPAQDTVGPWDISDWPDHLAELSRVAAHEAMDLFGAITAEKLGQAFPTLRARAWGQVLARSGSGARPTGTPQAAPEILRRIPSHRGFYSLDTLDLRLPRFDGTLSEPLKREVFHSFDAALVLPFDPVRNRVAFVQQARMGAIGRGEAQPFLLEPVAGLIDPGERPEAAARREASEEAGLDFDALEEIAKCYASPGGSTSFFHCYLGLCDISSSDPWFGGAQNEDEDIRVLPMDYVDALALLDDGQIDVAPLAMMMHWLARHHARLIA